MTIEDDVAFAVRSVFGSGQFPSGWTDVQIPVGIKDEVLLAEEATFQAA